MAEEMVQVSLDGLVRLQSAAGDFARQEIGRVTEAVIVELRSRPALGLFGDVAARHMWDEYCWTLQEGPFDDELNLGGVRLGSLSGNWDKTVRAFVSGEVEKLPKHALIFLSAHAFDEDGDSDENESLGSVWVDGIINTIMEEINAHASRRNLQLIGPHRADVIGSEIEGGGSVWSALSDRGEATDLISDHVDTMINADADLAAVAATLADAFLSAAREDVEGGMLADFFDRFADDIRQMLLEKDILPGLDDMRSQLIERLDKN